MKTLLLICALFAGNTYAYDNQIICGKDNTEISVGDSIDELLSNCGSPTSIITTKDAAYYTYVINRNGVITDNFDPNIAGRITIKITDGTIESVE